ncbi:MAG: sigma-70 family RNA polymerase sigma factor [Kofleriaceae bacterium]
MATGAAEDLELLERWRAGDKAAGEELFARHFDSLCSFFITKCSDADELVQRTLLACVRGRDQFRAQSSFRTYLFAIARNELYQYLRRLQKDRDRFDVEVSSVADLITTPATKLVKRREQQRMIESLRRLPVEQQTLLELYYWQDLDVAALAEVFELTPNAVRVRLHRARQELRERLVAAGDQESAAWLDASPKST